MLSLKTLTENSASLRAHEPVPKPRNAGESRPTDFQSYLAAVQQPANPTLGSTTLTEQQARKQYSESVHFDQPTGVHHNEGKTTPQKAGHEEIAIEDIRSQRAEKNPQSAQEKPKTVAITRNDRELLEALGLIRYKDEGMRGDTGTLRRAMEAVVTKKTVTPAQKPLFTKGETPTQTLTLLEKAPDLVLMSADGLKKLGEKLGLSLLSKVNEKLNEKNRTAERNPNPAQPDAIKTEAVAIPLVNRMQKAGEREAGQNTQEQSRAQRSMQARTVSRETIASTQENFAVAGATKGEITSNAVHLEPTAARNSTMVNMGELRLYDAAHSARQVENTRTAVENPLLRPELVRQFNEIMNRAQVLIQDTQNAQFSVRLYPREIGRMEIDLKLIDGEIRGKIVVESEEVKNEMQNFLQNSQDNSGAEKYDLNKIDIEVRSGNRNAQNPQKTPEPEELLRNIVAHSAVATYDTVEAYSVQQGALYA